MLTLWTNQFMYITNIIVYIIVVRMLIVFFFVFPSIVDLLLIFYDLFPFFLQ